MCDRIQGFFYKKPLIRISTLRSLKSPLLGKYNLRNYSFFTKEILDIFYSIFISFFAVSYYLEETFIKSKHFGKASKTLFWNVQEGTGSGQRKMSWDL